MIKVLLTGSHGFIGSYFIKKYASTYTFKKFSFFQEKLSELDCSGVDAVVHLSALVHQMDGASAEEYHKVNVIQTLSLAHAARAAGVGHFVFMSTVKVYGEENNIPYTETTPCNPVDDYGKSKLLAEQELLKLQSDQFIISIIRTPIVYGAGVKANIKNLITLIKKVPLLPLGGIQNLRSMVYIGNLSHLIDTVLDQKANGIFLAADDSPISTTNLIQKIADALEVKRYVVAIPFFKELLRLSKPQFYQRLYGNLIVDNTLTKQQLGLQNPYSTDEGIKLMIQGIQ